MTPLFDEPVTFPATAVESIYKIYPRKENKGDAIKRINEALGRICMGEIDGKPRTAAEAIEFLRERTEAARQQMFSRGRKFIPHPTTWYHQSRYLRPEVSNEEIPKRLDECIQILTCYPRMPAPLTVRSNYVAYLPALREIEKALERVKKTMFKGRTPQSPRDYLCNRTTLYQMAVKQWPEDELKFVPNPKRWFEESRYEQPEATWSRRTANGFSEERNQLKRLLQ